jgi:DNA-binding SARP family transcriptional activator
MRPERRHRPTMGMRGLLLWLALGSLLWYRLIGWPPPALPPLPQTLPSWAMVDVSVRSPLATDWTGFVATIGLVGWAFWAWAWATVLLEVAVNLADAATHGAAWVLAARAALRPVTVPFVRRVVDASLGGLLLARVALQPVAMGVAIPWQAEAAAVAPSSAGWAHGFIQREAMPRKAEVLKFGAVQWAAQDTAGQEDGHHELLYHVQPGDSLWAIAERFYGDGEQEVRLFAANVGQVQPDGGALTRHGVIQPNWILRVPEPTQGIESDAGEWWYSVQPGDTLDSICARLLGDANRSDEVFQVNRGTQTPDGHVLLNPNLIWPGLRLRLPLMETSAPEPQAEEPAADATPAPAPDAATGVGASPDRLDRVSVLDPTPTPTVSVPAAPVAADAPMSPPTELPSPTPIPTIQPVAEPVQPDTGRPVSPEAAALGAAGLAAAALAANRFVVRRRRSAPVPSEPESDVHIENGFADADPVEDLARRLAHSSDPAAAIASLLGQAFTTIFDEQLSIEERREASEGVTLAATRHGRTSTTLVLAAPVAARPYLCNNMRAAAERAFGEQVDVDGLVGQDGDVLVRVTWHPRRPIDGQLLERVNAGIPGVWPAPCLVPALVLFDRQYMSINWHTVRNILVAAPTGQGTEVPLSALVAALASRRTPEDLGLVVVARPHTLPNEIGFFPHGLLDVVDPASPEAVQRAFESVKLEIDRRRESGGTNEADLVVVVHELGDIEPDALQVLGAIAAAGPQYGVRLLAASERPVAELLKTCPFIDHFGTRLVLQTATEEDSVALLGRPGAEYLGAGGLGMLRLEGRQPVQGWTRRVSADRLSRLVHMMGSRAPDVAAPRADETVDVPADPVERDDLQETATDAHTDNATTTQDAGERPAAARTGSKLVDRLRAAPIRVRCFGAGEAWHGDRLLEIADPELLLLLAVHPVAGIRSEALADMLWGDKVPDDIRAALRKERFNLRGELRRLVPDLAADPLPGNQTHGENVVCLDTSLVSSDVQEFTELLNYAEKEKLEPAAAIEVYEAALGLYRGDLLDSTNVFSYRWMYNEDPQIALMLRSDLRRRHKETRLRLAELLAQGPEASLARAEELYSDLCAEDPENERLWTALFRIHERTGSVLGLKGAVNRLRGALAELGADGVSDINSVPLPPNLDRIVEAIRSRIENGAQPTT